MARKADCSCIRYLKLHDNLMENVYLQSMSIDDSFYKNVFLLMQVVPASFECTKHFKKGMFNKPNTFGFIHISHYLLSVHNSKQFQKMVKWPIMNKTDEKQYRTEIKYYLNILANENPDINFPPILVSHLFQAGGIRFLNIMWKISEIALKAYIRENYLAKLLQAPKTGKNYHITKTYLANINLRRSIVIFDLYEKAKLTLKSFEHYMQRKIDHLKNVRADIFNTIENIEKYVHEAPVNSLITIHLRNIENLEIINLWKTSINQNIMFLKKKNTKLNKVKTLSNALYNLILNLFVNCTIFDGNNLPNVNFEIVRLFFNNNIKHINNRLYKNDCLIFHTLLLILNQILNQVKYCLKMNDLLDLSSWEPKIIDHCKTIKSMEEMFQKHIIEVSDMSNDVQSRLQQKNVNCSVIQEIISTSANLNSSINICGNDEMLFERLSFTPVQGKYKYLFKRYNRKPVALFEQSTINLQLNNGIENMTNMNIPIQRQSLIYKQKSANKIKVSPIYFRLFSSNNSKKIYFKGINAISTPLQSQISETPKKPQIQSSKLETINLNAAIKDI